MTAGKPIDVVRAITTAFAELDFASFRDALAEADRLEDLAASGQALGELMPEVIDPEVHIHLHDIHAAHMVGHDFDGWDGWLRFWRAWLEPWNSYSVGFSRWEELGDTVMYRLAIEARGRGSGVEVRDRIIQAWTLRDGKVVRLAMYASSQSALADLNRD